MLKPVFCLWQPEGGPGPADEEDAGKGRKRSQDGHCADESHREGEEETVCGIIIIIDTKKHEEEGRVRRPFALPRRSVHTHINVEGCLEQWSPTTGSWTGTGPWTGGWGPLA